MADESCASRGDDVGSPSDTVGAGSHTASDPTAATATAAAEDNGHMQQQQQQGHGEPAPFANTGDEDSVFATTVTKTTPPPPTDPTAAPPPAGHATGEHKEPVSPTDLAASPRSGAPGFVAPSSYLRPLAATRDREDHFKTGKQPFAGSESGAKRVMHPLDIEQREGLVSDLTSSLFGSTGGATYCLYRRAKNSWLTWTYSARSEPSSRSEQHTMSYR